MRPNAFASFKKSSTKTLLLVGLSALAIACAAGGSSPHAPVARGASPGAAADTAPAPATAEGSGGSYAPRQEKNDRPGLATHWGETRSSHIRNVSFERANPSQPFATTSLWYNNQRGARAQADAASVENMPRGKVAVAEEGISVELVDERGRVLPGFRTGGKVFAVGRSGRRYSIVLHNHTPARFEAVVSVDGLDVIDGQSASFSKRGYLLSPHSDLRIDGFRKNMSQVAAFRFGNVKRSYAARSTGDARNVGVIGFAFFHERGNDPWPWHPGEVRKRENANPFPGRFAKPPPNDLIR